MLLGLYNTADQLDLVGFVSGFPNANRRSLSAKLSPLIGGPGFTGKAPAGPSRWSRDKNRAYLPLKHDLVVEVVYDQVSAGRFRHGALFLRWRPDKAPHQCRTDQLQPALKPAEVLQLMG